MVRPMSSTACRVRLGSALPILKCRCRPSGRSSAPVPGWSDGAADSTGARAPAGKAAPASPAPGPGAPPRRAAGSLMARLLPLVQEAPDERAVHLVQLGGLHLAPGHHLPAAPSRPAAGGDAGQVGRA